MGAAPSSCIFAAVPVIIFVPLFSFSEFHHPLLMGSSVFFGGWKTLPLKGLVRNKLRWLGRRRRGRKSRMGTGDPDGRC